MKTGKGNIGIYVFIFFALVFMFFGSGKYGGDGLENYLTAESIVLDGDFAIYDHPFDIKEMRHEERGTLNPDSGKRVSSYGLGMAFILVPFYLLGHMAAGFVPQIPHGYITQFFVALSNPLILALLAGLIFKFLLKLGYTGKTAFLSTAIYSFCTMSFIYCRSGFSEPMVALLVLSAVYSVFSFTKEKKAASLLVAGFCLAYAIFIKKNSLILLPGFLIYLVYSCWNKKEIKKILGPVILFLLPVILAILAIFLQNNILYGGALRTEFGSTNDLLANVTRKSFPIKGLYYYLLSSGKGYFIYNLALILGLFAIKDFARKFRGLLILISCLWLANLFFYAFIFTRGSIFSWGPRYLFPTLPFLALFLAEFIEKSSRFQRKFAVFSWAGLGFLIQLPNLIVNISKYIFFVKEKLGLPEYLIDFMPELSPIKGAWMLFISFLKRHFFGAGEVFLYDPDFKFIPSVKASLAGYDIADIWWINIIKVNPAFTTVAIGLAASLVILILIIFRRLNSQKVL